MFPLEPPSLHAESREPEHQLGESAEEISLSIEQVKKFLPVGWFELVDNDVWTTPTTYGEQDFRQHPFFQIPEEGTKRSAKQQDSDMEMDEGMDEETKSTVDRTPQRVYKK